MQTSPLWLGLLDSSHGKAPCFRMHTKGGQRLQCHPWAATCWAQGMTLPWALLPSPAQGAGGRGDNSNLLAWE